MEMKKPAASSLFGTVEVLLEFEIVIAVALIISVRPSSRKSKEDRDINVCLWKGLRKINLMTMKIE